jgi:ABC-type transport system involved in multi-copper enzyme maturation permease subunit
MTAVAAPSLEPRFAGTVGRVLAVAALSAREAFRSRSMLVAIILNVLYLGFLAFLGFALGRSLDEQAAFLNADVAVRLFLTFALGGASALALFTGVFGSVGSIAGEIERGTILAVVARPIDRWEILAGKFIGHGALALMYLVAQGLIIGGAVTLLTGRWIGDLVPYLALLGLNVLIMVALSLAGSTRLSTVANAICVVVLYLAVTNTGILYFIGGMIEDRGIQAVADYLRFILPVGPISDIAGEILAGPALTLLTGGGAGAAEALGRDVILPRRDWMWLYGVAYLVATLTLAAWSLRRRDLR